VNDESCMYVVNYMELMLEINKEQSQLRNKTKNLTFEM